ncbi:MAG: HEAT repeat domain-containing protein [Planctomycetes bacterium]|nr:HEAT repeat domain-containing protein [Planctomycetota bacterium]
MRLRSVHCVLACLAVSVAGLPARCLPAQLEEPFATWNRHLAEHRMSVPAAAEWFAEAAKPLGDEAVPKLRRFLEEPMLARSFFERLPAALALKRFGIHHLEPALRSPRAEIRTAAAMALLAPITETHCPWPVTTEAAPGAFEDVPYSPDTPVKDFLRGLTRPEAKERTFCLAVLQGYRPAGDEAYRRERTTRLLEALDDKDPRIRAGAARGLFDADYGGLHDQVLERLRKASADPDPDVRAAAFAAIPRVPGKDTEKLKALVRGLQDPEDRVVMAAADAIEWLQGENAALPALLDTASKDRAPYARAAILEAIASVQQGEAAAVEAARVALAAPEPEVRRAALRTLMRMGPAARSAIEAVRAAAKDPHPFVRASAVLTLPRLGDRTREAAELIADAMEDASANVRVSAFAAMRELLPAGLDWAPERFARGLSDPADDVRHHAAHGLRMVGSWARPHAAALVARLADPDIHDPVYTTLAALGADAMPALVERLKSGSTTARFDVVGLLAGIGPPAVEPVAARLEDRHEDVRSAAASALAWMGPVARRAEPALIRLTTAGPAALRPIAAWALYRINTAEPPSPELVAAAGKDRLCAWALIEAVQSCGEAPPAVIPLLESALDGDDGPLADAAADAIIVCRVDPGKRHRHFADPATSDAELIERVQTSPRAERAAAMRTLLSRPADAAMAVAALIGRTYGVEIVGAAPPLEQGWCKLPEITGRGSALSAEGEQEACRRLALALAAYPPELVHTYLKKIVVLRELRIRTGRVRPASELETPYGGTYRGTTVYLAAGERPDRNLVAAFHHEFSSLLFTACDFPESSWRAIHEPDFEYGGGGVTAIHRGSTGEGTADLYIQGFFKPYARADLENDFNVFSETVMTYPLWAAATLERYPRLAAKARLWQEHLTGLDSAFEPPVRLPAGK